MREKHKILFVTTVPLYPLTDGIRIPATNHFLILNSYFSVDVLVLDTNIQCISNDERRKTREAADNVSFINIIRKPIFSSIFLELTAKIPFYGAYECQMPIPEWIKHTKYEFIWCATPAAVGVFSNKRIRNIFHVNNYVAGLSDIHSLVIWQFAKSMSKSNLGSKKYIFILTYILRTYVLKKAESNMLSKFDLITMQTAKEYEWLKSIGIMPHSKLAILSNGVSEELFDIPIKRVHANLLFIGSLSGIYAQRLKWFILEVWPKIIISFPYAQLHVIGKNVDNELLSLFEDNNIVHKSFVEDITLEYEKHPILIAPIFKGYGLINKVIESMAAGCLVVGDKTAFNGIDNFVDRTHAYVAQDVGSFQKIIINVLSSGDYKKEVRIEGRKLIKGQFRWHSRYEKLINMTTDLINKD